MDNYIVFLTGSKFLKFILKSVLKLFVLNLRTDKMTNFTLSTALWVWITAVDTYTVLYLFNFSVGIKQFITVTELQFKTESCKVRYWNTYSTHVCNETFHVKVIV